MMSDKGSGAKIIFHILILIISAVLIFSVIRIAFGSTSLSFYSFLEYASNTPQINVEYTKVISVVGSWPSWALWLKTIFDVIANVLNVVWWIMRNIANLLVFVTYYITLLFVT